MGKIADDCFVIYLCAFQMDANAGWIKISSSYPNLIKNILAQLGTNSDLSSVNVQL